MYKKIVITSLLIFSFCVSGPASAQNHSKNLQSLGADDIMFAQMMIPHHEQAVEMAKIALKKSPGKELAELSKEIISSQNREINEMEFWLKAKKASKEMHHSMPMKGMLTTKDFKNLQSSTGTNFQKIYISLMIKHHEGAIEMVSLLGKSKNREATKLGNSILVAQKAEIALMKKLLKRY